MTVTMTPSSRSRSGACATPWRTHSCSEVSLTPRTAQCCTPVGSDCAARRAVASSLSITRSPSSSAFDDVDREAAACGLLVFRLHVGTGLPHGLDDLVQADVMRAVAAHRHARGVDGLHRRDGVAL